MMMTLRIIISSLSSRPPAVLHAADRGGGSKIGSSSNNSIIGVLGRRTLLSSSSRRSSATTLLQQQLRLHRRLFSTSSSSSAAAAVSSNKIRVDPNHSRFLVFGANTDVGKTIVSAGLVRSSLLSATTASASSSSGNDLTYYIKPLQTGVAHDRTGSDASFVERYCTDLGGNNNSRNNRSLVTKTLYNWQTPTSPHHACRLENQPVNDTEVIQSLSNELVAITNTNNNANNQSTTCWIETAGGVLSPSSSSPANREPYHAHIGRVGMDGNDNNNNNWGWIPQADLYQQLGVGQFPVVLVGDGKLGGISSTLSALESLILRGYDVASIIFIDNNDDSNTDNVDALREYIGNRKFALRSGSGDALLAAAEQSILGLPPIPSDINVPLDDWFASDDVANKFQQLHQHLMQYWHGNVDDMKSLPTDGNNVIWWPFTQHGSIADGSSQDNDSDNTKVQITHIDSACGDNYHVLVNDNNGDEKGPKDLVKDIWYDGCASWWTQGVGHGLPSMALAAASAAGRYGHTIFPETVHSPAVTLSQKLLGRDGPGHEWASRVFFTDNGSTAMEVAIKMGIRLYKKRMNIIYGDDDNDYADDNDSHNIDWVVCAQADCYHGDTLGVMDVAEPSIFNEGQHPWYEPKGLFLETPTLGFQDGALKIQFPDGLEPPPSSSSTSFDKSFDSISRAMDVRARKLTSLYSHYKEIIEMQWLVYEHMHSNDDRKTVIGSVMIEPVLQGAGGMKFVDPLWQSALVDVAKSRSVPVVYDEIASGLHRVGVTSCRAILQQDPDIASYAKLLTGGLLPLSVTLASNEVFESFLGDSKGQALLHGHSYTAHPVGCVTAIHALDAYKSILKEEEEDQPSTKKMPAGIRMLFDEEQTKLLSKLPIVEKCFTLGTVLAVTIYPEDGEGGYGASSRTVPIAQHLRQKEGIYARPLGNVLYIMASPLTSRDECSRLANILYRTIRDF